MQARGLVLGVLARLERDVGRLDAVHADAGVLAAQAAQMQISARSASGTRASRSGPKEAAWHQQVVAGPLASAMTQRLGPPQRGQTPCRAGAVTGFDTRTRADGPPDTSQELAGLK